MTTNILEGLNDRFTPDLEKASESKLIKKWYQTGLLAGFEYDIDTMLNYAVLLENTALYLTRAQDNWPSDNTLDFEKAGAVLFPLVRRVLPAIEIPFRATTHPAFYHHYLDEQQDENGELYFGTESKPILKHTLDLEIDVASMVKKCHDLEYYNQIDREVEFTSWLSELVAAKLNETLKDLCADLVYFFSVAEFKDNTLVVQWRPMYRNKPVGPSDER